MVTQVTVFWVVTLHRIPTFWRTMLPMSSGWRKVLQNICILPYHYVVSQPTDSDLNLHWHSSTSFMNLFINTKISGRFTWIWRWPWFSKLIYQGGDDQILEDYFPVRLIISHMNTIKTIMNCNTINLLERSHYFTSYDVLIAWKKLKYTACGQFPIVFTTIVGNKLCFIPTEKLNLMPGNTCIYEQFKHLIPVLSHLQILLSLPFFDLLRLVKEKQDFTIFRSLITKTLSHLTFP
jgi:hypothetical protein